MSIFQYIALPVIFLLIALSLLNLHKGKRRKRMIIPWICIWIIAGLAIYKPNTLTIIANYLGIVRGADLVFYCAVLLGIFSYFRSYILHKKISNEITNMTRKIAIRDAIKPYNIQEKTDRET